MPDFPIVLTNAIDGVPGVGTGIVAKHLNNLEAKVGINESAVETSLDFLVKNRYKMVHYVGDPIYPTLAAAVATLNAAGSPCTLVAPAGAHSIAANLTVNSVITLLPLNGADIQIDVGVTLNILGRCDAGRYRVFSGSGAVTGLKSALPEWFGAVGDDTNDDGAALQKCMDSSKVTFLLDGSTYKFTAILYPPADHNVVSHGPGAVLHRSSSGPGLYPYNNVVLRQFTLRGDGGGVYAAGANGITILYNNGAWVDPGGVINRDQNDPAKWRGAFLTVDRLVIEDWSANGMGAGPDSVIDSVLIRDCVNEGMLIPGDRVAINMPTVRDCWGWGIDLNCSGTQIYGGLIKNCGNRLLGPGGEDCGGLCIIGHTHVNGTNFNKVVGVTVDGSTNAGVTVMAPSTYDYQMKGNVLLGLTIRNVCSNTTDAGLSALNIVDNSTSGTKLNNTQVIALTIDGTTTGHGIHIIKSVRTVITGYSIANVYGMGVLASNFSILVVSGGSVSSFGGPAYKFINGSDLSFDSFEVLKTTAIATVIGVLVENVTRFDIGSGFVTLDTTHGYGVFLTGTSGHGCVSRSVAKTCYCGIYDNSTGGYNRILDNDLSDGNTIPMSIVGTVTGYRVKGNIGYLSENSGKSDFISTGGTIAHGLAATPAYVNATAAEAGPTDIYVSADANNITVNFGGGGSKTFYWEARLAQSL